MMQPGAKESITCTATIDADVASDGDDAGLATGVDMVAAATEDDADGTPDSTCITDMDMNDVAVASDNIATIATASSDDKSADVVDASGSGTAVDSACITDAADDVEDVTDADDAVDADAAIGDATATPIADSIGETLLVMLCHCYARCQWCSCLMIFQASVTVSVR